MADIFAPAEPQEGFPDIFASARSAFGPEPSRRQPGQQPSMDRQSIREQVLRYARQFGIPPMLALALVDQESGFNPRATSSAGARGLTQLMPGTAKAEGVSDPFDVAQSLTGGFRHLQGLYRKYQDWGLALAAFNAGEGAVDRYKGIPPYGETQRYVHGILASAGLSGEQRTGARPAGSQTPTAGGFPDIFTPAGATQPSGDTLTAPAPQQPTPSKPRGMLGAIEGIFSKGTHLVGEGIKDILRTLRVPQQASAIALADFVVKNHRPPSVSEWLQAASEAVRSDKSFSDVLGDAGVPAGLARTIEGMILDVVADPLWIITPAEVARIAGLPKMLEVFKSTPAAKALAESPIFRKGMRGVWDPWFAMPKAYVQAKLAEVVGVNKGWQSGLSLGQAIGKLKPEEQQFITRYMELGAPHQYGEANVGRALQETTEQLRLLKEAGAKGLNVEKIRELGQAAKIADLQQLRELVDIGVIPKKMVDPFWDLPGHDLLGIGPDMDRLKAMNEMFAKNPREFARRRAQTSAMGLPLTSLHIRREYRFWEDPEGFIQKLAQSDPKKAAILQEWWRTRAGMSSHGTYRPFALNFGFIQSRDEHITQIIRDAMGEIREAAHPIATSLIEGRRFVELHKFLKKVADEFAVDLRGQPFKPGLRPIPVNKMWGPLSGKWLPADIADDILKTVGRDETGFARLLKKARAGVGWWKYGKIVLSPASHARIILHNVLLWDWSGSGGIMKIGRLNQALRALAQGEKNQLYREMMQSGVVLHNTFADQLLDDLLTRDPAIIASPSNWQHMMSNLGRASANIFKGTVGNRAERLMAFEERLFKAAVFAEQRSLSKSIEESAMLTNEALLNYKRMPEFWNMIRQFGILPFVAFPLQATTRAGRAIARRPAVVGKYGKVFRDIETARSGQSPQQLAGEKQVLPPEMDEGIGWLRLGRNPDGTTRYLNLAYVMPLWILPESFRAMRSVVPGAMGPKRWSSAMQAGFLNISAYPLAKAMIEGVDPFTNKHFTSWSDFLGYLYRFATPSLVGTFPQQIWAAAHGTPVDVTSSGKPRRVQDIFARNFLAWSVRSFDPNMEKVWRMRELQSEIKDVEKEMRRISLSPYLSQEDRDRLLAEQMDKIRAIIDVLSRTGSLEMPEDGVPASATMQGGNNPGLPIEAPVQPGVKNPFQ